MEQNKKKAGKAAMIFRFLKPYVSITDEEAVCAFEYLSRMEGIIPAIESAHAVAAARKIAPTMKQNEIMVICLSGRGDKDVYQVARYRGVDIHE